MASAFDQYGYIATLANSIPELKSIMNKALAGKWTPDKFSQAVQDSRWWKVNSDQVKQNAILRATKPGEYAAQRGAMTLKVRTLAKSMGVGLTEGSHGTLNALINHAMALGWDDTTLQQQIGHYYHYRGGTSAGQAGALQQQIRQLRADYGLGNNDQMDAHHVHMILMGQESVDSFKAAAAQSAESRYPGFAQQLREGQTMTQIADPYIQTIAQTLEMSPADVDLMDPSVQRAITARDPKTGHNVPMSLWQVQDMMRQDPRYDHTKQAVSDAYSMINQIGKDWGFSA
jgi:hypothetical protein